LNPHCECLLAATSTAIKYARMLVAPQPTLEGRRVFVTGANGFIGRRLVQALDQVGAKVSILCRSGRGTTARHAPSVRSVVGDLHDSGLLAIALRDQEIVFHLAYDGRATAAANLAAFDSVVAAFAEASVARIVHTSSIVVYDDWPDGDLDESSSMSRFGGSGYRQAKIEMERRLMAGSIPAAILQPTIVYGPGSTLWTEQFLEWLSSGDIVLPAPEGHCNGVFVDDLVQALIRAATLRELGQERFIISGAESFPWSRLLEGYAQIVGSGGVEHVPVEVLQSRLGPKPDDDHDGEGPSRAAVIHAAGRRIFGRERFERMLRAIKGRLARDGRMYPDRHLLELFSATGHCRIRHARERLGFNPEFDLAKGLATTAADVRDR
jgi:nucleoside-diphosphate-sugar epimerase